MTLKMRLKIWLLLGEGREISVENTPVPSCLLMSNTTSFPFLSFITTYKKTQQ